MPDMKNRGSRLMLLAAVLCVAATAAPAQDAAHAVDETGRVESVPAHPGAHWVWIYDAALSSMPDGRALLLDGDTGHVFGMLSTGYSWVALAHPRVPGAEFYSAETYYSRHTRGTRTDVVTVYDGRALAPIAEVVLPAKRASTIPRLNDSALTDDDRFMAVFNLTPATSLSIVDVKSRRFVGEIGIPGCSLVFPVGPRAFFSLCFNGAALVTELKDDGTLARQYRVEKIFDADGDFMADNGARSGAAWYFPSLDGHLYVLDFSSGILKASRAASLLTDAERAAGWRMSGFQGIAVHPDRGELYFLVHRGTPDTYKEPGTEVRVYELASAKPLRHLPLQHPASAIAVSADTEPLLAAVAMDGAVLDLYAAASGKHLRTVTDVGVTPALVQFPVQNP